MHRTGSLALIFLLLTACSPTPTSTPAPQLGRVVTTPAFEVLVSSWIRAFPLPDGARFELLVAPLSELAAMVESGEADIAISGAPPPTGWFATPLAREPLAVAVHPANPVRSYSLEDLVGLFSGSISNWSALDGRSRAVQPMVPFEGDELRMFLDAGLLAGSRPSATALLAPSPSKMAAMIAGDAGGIGLLPLTHADATVRVVRVEGVLPAAETVQNGSYRFWLVVSAFAPDEPSGLLRDWLVWIQSTQPQSEPDPE